MTGSQKATTDAVYDVRREVWELKQEQERTNELLEGVLDELRSD